MQCYSAGRSDRAGWAGLARGERRRGEPTWAGPQHPDARWGWGGGVRVALEANALLAGGGRLGPP